MATIRACDICKKPIPSTSFIADGRMNAHIEEPTKYRNFSVMTLVTINEYNEDGKGTDKALDMCLPCLSGLIGQIK